MQVIGRIYLYKVIRLSPMQESGKNTVSFMTGSGAAVTRFGTESGRLTDGIAGAM